MLSLAVRERIAEGKVQGRAEGLHEGQARTLLRLLERRFGSASDAVRARVNVADFDTIDRVLDASTLDSVFKDDQEH